MSTHCRKCGKEKEASRPRSHLCRTCDKKAKGTVSNMKFDLGQIHTMWNLEGGITTLDYETMELKIMAHQAKALIGPLKITLPDTWETATIMPKKHNSSCGCPQCSEELMDRWIRQKSQHLIDYHMRFNSGREDFDPNLVHAMIVQMCTETKDKIKEGVAADMAQRSHYRRQLQEKLAAQQRRIGDLERELEARKSAATATVPSTEGRLFREE